MQKQPTEEYRKIRIEKLQKIKKAGINPYPSSCIKKNTANETQGMEGKKTAVAGRIRAWRGHGNMQFADLHDETGKIQIVFKADEFKKEEFKFLKLLDIGDFLAVQGKVFKTKSGEVSVLVKNFQLLAKSLRPLPDKWHGISDIEGRYRRRYLDFIFNKSVKEKILLRTKAIKAIREYLDNNGFIEVETPILETTASGALAKPFKTHINAYSMDVFLRICIGELWQKRLMAAGFEKTYELGRAFRNEGVSKEHNPEFTMLEYYWAYADFKQNMDFQEKLIAFVVKKATGEYKVEYQKEIIDFTPPYPRKKYFDLIKEETNIDIPKLTKEELSKKAKHLGLKIDKKWSFPKLIDEFYKEFVRPKIKGPMFLTHHPVELKPLAKLDQQDQGVVESFQLLIAGFEVSNNYSELNNPLAQLKNFNQQKEMKEKGDEEAMVKDNDFIEALEYGMPPTTGTGIGIDRFVSLISDSHSIREVITFPLMKPKE